MSVASRHSTRASKRPVHNSCLSLGASSPGRRRVCVLFGFFFPGRVLPDRTTRRHGLARPPPNLVGWAERVVTMRSVESAALDRSGSAGGGPAGGRRATNAVGTGRTREWGAGSPPPSPPPPPPTATGGGPAAATPTKQRVRETRHGRRNVVGDEEASHHRCGGEHGKAGARHGATHRRRRGGRRRSPDHVHPGPPAAFGGRWRVNGGIDGFNAAGGDEQGGRHRHGRG